MSAVSVRHKCDGCGVVADVTIPPGMNTQVAVEGWTVVETKVANPSAGGYPSMRTVLVELCGDCFHGLNKLVVSLGARQ